MKIDEKIHPKKCPFSIRWNVLTQKIQYDSIIPSLTVEKR